MSTNTRIKSKSKKSKLEPVPHNNRARTAGRLSSTQIILMKDKDDPNKITKKTIFHMNLSPFEQQRAHLMKVALETEDRDIMKKLTPRERRVYDTLLIQKQLREGAEANDNGNNN